MSAQMWRKRGKALANLSKRQLFRRPLLTIAIPKGRMQDDTLALFAGAGVRTDEDRLSTRSLTSEDESGNIDSSSSHLRTFLFT
jgi:hypothetical protein